MKELSEQSGFLQNKNIVMFVITVSFILGVAGFFQGSEFILAIFVTICIITLLCANVITRRFAILAVVMFYAGFFNAQLRIKDFDSVALHAPAESKLSGRIISIPETTGKTCKFYLDVKTIDNIPIKGKTLVWLNDDKHNFDNFKIGNMYSFEGNLRRPKPATNPEQFDYSKFLRNKSVFSIIYTTPGNSELTDTKLPPKWFFIQKLNDLRHKILDVHKKYVFSPNIEILGGIVFGDDAISPPEHIKNSFINSGLLHILAASGMNVAAIWGFWYFFMRRFRVNYKLTLISGIILVLIYTLMTGLGASVVRAGLMLIFVLVGKLIDRDAHSVSLLSFVALLMLIYNPAYLNDIGFQMSFLATMGILIMAKPIQEKMKNVKLPEIVKGDMVIPVIAQGWVVPAQMFYFNTFAPYSIFANIAIIPFLCLVSFGGFVSSILAIFYPVTKYFCMGIDYCLNILISVIVSISNFFSAVPHSLLITPKPSILQILIYFSIIGIISYCLKEKFTKKSLTLSGILIILIFLCGIHIPDKSLEIITFDVQNADCFLIKTPKNDYFVIDTGKFPFTSKNSQASSTIGKYLKNKGIRKIKGLIITHFDNDHSGGGAYIIDNFKIEKVYLADDNQKTQTAATIFNALDFNATPFVIAQNGDVIYDINGLKLTLIRSGIEKKDNENSIQTLLDYKDFKMLFTGDAGSEAYEKIQSMIDGEIDVLKVGHHGARGVTSSEMLKNLNPKLAIISTGTNRFGHPSKQTIENLNHFRIKTLRTDYDNAIKLKTDGIERKIYTYNAKKKSELSL